MSQGNIAETWKGSSTQHFWMRTLNVYLERMSYSMFAYVRLHTTIVWKVGIRGM